MLTIERLRSLRMPSLPQVGGLHNLGADALASLVLVHAGAAILHRVIPDDGVLDSMLPVPRKPRDTRIQAVSAWRIRR